MKTLLTSFIFILPIFANAQTPAEAAPLSPVWSHESEVGIATIGGNTESETYTAKQTTSYTFDAINRVGFSSRYLRAESAGLESARNWDAALRYERGFAPRLSGYVGYGLESDVFAGYVQRNNADIGAKYEIARSKPTTWIAEAGYRNTDTIAKNVPGKQNTDFARIYTEASQMIGDQSSIRLWVEYLPSLEDMEDYRLNFEPSLTTQLSGIFSLKTSYLVKYQSALVPPTTKYADRFFTTALVAKF